MTYGFWELAGTFVALVFLYHVIKIYFGYRFGKRIITKTELQQAEEQPADLPKAKKFKELKG